MAFSKVILNGDTLMDVTADTVVAEQLRSTYTATKADGTKITGSMPTAQFTGTIEGGTLTPIGTVNNMTTSGGLNTYNNNIYVEYGASGTQITCSPTVTTGGYIQTNGAMPTITRGGSRVTSFVYIKGVTLTAPQSGTSQFDITVPNGESTITFHFSVDSSGNVTIT